MSVRLMVVTSCTGRKAVDPPGKLIQADFAAPERLRAREAELAPFLTPAGQLYTGQQHVQTMRGVERVRRQYGPESVNVRIVSAGYGVVPEDRPLAPYEVTFNDLGRREAWEWGHHLRIPQELRRAVEGQPLVVFLLGARYLDAVEPPVLPAAGQRFVFLAGPAEAKALSVPGVTVVPAGRTEASRYRSGMVALKGRMFDLFSRGLPGGGEALWSSVLADDTPASFLRAVDLGVRQD